MLSRRDYSARSVDFNDIQVWIEHIGLRKARYALASHDKPHQIAIRRIFAETISQEPFHHRLKVRNPHGKMDVMEIDGRPLAEGAIGMQDEVNLCLPEFEPCTCVREGRAGDFDAPKRLGIKLPGLRKITCDDCDMMECCHENYSASGHDHAVT
jgi:hypothetical protein